MASCCIYLVRVVVIAMATVLWCTGSVEAQVWRGLRVAQESRCSQYKASDYSYPQSVEVRIINKLGGIWSPYTGRVFATRWETEIEHIVARSEAHDSGLCAASANQRRQFSKDLLNLTLASRDINQKKSGKDAAEWWPILNQCWFANQIVLVRQKYNLTIDRREANKLDRVLGSCTSTALVRGSASVVERVEFKGREDQLATTEDDLAADILGVWDTTDGAHVEVYERDNTYHGKFVLFYDEPPAGGFDIKNPDPTLRDRPLLDTDFILNFEFVDKKWKNGRIYNPDNGKQYRADLELKDGVLKVRGWIWIRLLGRTVEWQRIN